LSLERAGSRASAPAVPRSLPMRVALDATPLLGERTGVGEFCAGALAGLSARDDLLVSAFAVSWRRRHGIVGQLPAGVRVVRRPIPARPALAAWRHASVPPIEWFTGEVDVVHGTNFVVPPARRAARVVTVHDLAVVRYPQLCDAPTLAFVGSIRRAVGEGAWVHTPSRFVAEEVIAHFGVSPARVRAIHHGIPAGPSATGPLPRAPVKVPAGGPYVLALGTIEPRKDFPRLVHAFDALASSHPDLRLVIAGGRGWGAEAFDEAVASSAFRARIITPGYVDPAVLRSLLAGAGVFCYPSVYEGFGLPPLQAMAAGVPVVTTAVGAIPEVVGDAARLVAGGDTDALAEAIGSVLDDDGLRRRLIEAGRRRCAEFTWEAAAAGLAALYGEAALDHERYRPGRRTG
jgi:glycosyltransferase involved in cell wall biosynthesis